MDEPTDRTTPDVEALEPMPEAASADLTRPETGDESPGEADPAQIAPETPDEADPAEAEMEESPPAEGLETAVVEPEDSDVESEAPEANGAAEAVAEAEVEAEAEPEADAGDEPAATIEDRRPQAAAEAEPEGEAAAAPGEEPDDGRRWYVVHCYSGYEGKVRHNLEQRIESMGMKSKIFDVVIPTEEEIEVKDGKRRTVERHVFPGYILVQMLMDEDSWYVVRNTPGVTGFVGMGNEPTPLRPEEVQQIIRRMEAEAPRVKVTYKAGQRVRIIDGPFNDFIGTVDEIDMERAKVRVMVSFFGRETPVELDFLQVEKA